MKSHQIDFRFIPKCIYVSDLIDCIKISLENLKVVQEDLFGVGNLIHVLQVFCRFCMQRLTKPRN